MDALVLPGGESTVISKLMRTYGLDDRIVERARDGMPVMGTCAGAILLASNIEGDSVQPLGLMDMSVERNSYGRQVDSFESDVALDFLADGHGGPEEPFHSVFIRAPSIRSAGDDVDVLARHDDEIIAVRSGSILALTFHPELTEDLRVHRYFLGLLS